MRSLALMLAGALQPVVLQHGAIRLHLPYHTLHGLPWAFV